MNSAWARNSSLSQVLLKRSKETTMMDTSKIKEHMDVLDSAGKKIGQVDHLEGKDKIKLTKHGSPDGKHHFVPVSWIDHIDTHVHLNKPVNDVSALQMAS